MKHLDRINIAIKNTSLKNDFNFPDYSPHEYQCQRCGYPLKLYQKRVLYCRHCHKGKLHPRYVFKLDNII